MSTISTQVNVLLTVRSRAVADSAIAALRYLDVEFLAATTVDEVDAVLGRIDLDHVVMGGGLDLETRLLMVRRVLEASNSTTVHMGARSGPQAYLPFVRAVLDGLLAGRAAARRT